jgi:hypothetical protein
MVRRFPLKRWLISATILASKKVRGDTRIFFTMVVAVSQQHGKLDFMAADHCEYRHG